MTPIFEDYRTMLKSYGIDLSQYDTDKLWINRLIIRGFDKNGNDRKILRLKVTDELDYEYKWYTDIPKNDELETWEESYKRLEAQILDKEQESCNVIKEAVEKYPNYQYILTTSMGKDSKLVQYLLDKCNIKYRTVFNNTTCDSFEVYREVKANPNIEIVNAKNKDGSNKSIYKMAAQYGFATRQNRWCCSIFKEQNINDYLKSEHNIVEFLGMRNDESQKRKNYQFEKEDDRFPDDWHFILPICKWTELEVWLYTIHNNISINYQYKKGYNRVGCHIICPFATENCHLLDKYWYKVQFDRFHTMLHNDFINRQGWCWKNCTEKEFHKYWNTGMVREEPTDEVIREFMEYKGFNNYNLAKQYFKKTCSDCGKNVYHKDEIAMNLKLFGREINKFKCKKCIIKEMGWNKEDWNYQVKKFKDQGCTLF